MFTGLLLNPNLNVSKHIFEPLVKMSPDSQVIPCLAESWSLINKVTWEFKLRKGVKFHNGSELTAEDVAWSIDRPATIIGSPAKFDVFTKMIVNRTIIDPYTIRFTTKEPHPLLPADLTAVMMVSKKATQGVPSDDFSTGKGMVGTGPFKFVNFQRGDRVTLERNDAYWGTKAAWSKVTLRFISNASTRIAALLSGDVQAIEDVPTADLARVRGDANLSLFSKVSQRVIFLFPDTVRDKSPYVSDKDGRVLDKNPLRDAKVRTALSMAINRYGIKDRVMEGLSAPTNNIVPINFVGFNPALGDTKKFDPEGAKNLLAQAGYPNGFSLTLHTPNNRYNNDEKIALTTAQMWSAIGVNTQVVAQPMSVYSTQASKGTYSMGLLGWGATTGEASFPLRAIAACPNPETGLGGGNWGKYCNPKMDELLLKAMHTMEEKDRLKLLQEATAILINDGGIIPIHNQVTTWAAKKGVNFVPRSDEGTVAYDFRPK
jgi:peptide/nickel transport system substrate-binding protein